VPVERLIRVVLCDDHIVVLDGLTSVLEAVEGIEVAGVATDGEADHGCGRSATSCRRGFSTRRFRHAHG
jgi:hypothetical protein